MAQTIIVIDDGVDFNMHPATGLLAIAAVFTLLICLFKAFSIGAFATAGWWVAGIPFAFCGLCLFVVMLKP